MAELTEHAELSEVVEPGGEVTRAVTEVVGPWPRRSSRCAPASAGGAEPIRGAKVAVPGV